LPSWYAQRRADLLGLLVGLLDALETRIKPLNEAVLAAAEQNAEAQLLMTHPGVGPVVSLAYVLIMGDWRRFPRGKQVGSYLPNAAHFHSADLEFTYFGEHFGELICEPVEARAGVAIGERTAKH
jgi:transposase